MSDATAPGMTSLRVSDWRVEIGRELARQCPQLVVLALLTGLFLSAQRDAYQGIEKRLDRLTAAVERLADTKTAAAGVMPDRFDERSGQ